MGTETKKPTPTPPLFILNNSPYLKVKTTFLEEVLGTASSNPDIHSDHIAKKSADADKLKEELAALPAEELEERSITVFPRDTDGTPMLWDYQVKGFFKDAFRALMEIDGSPLDTKDKQKKLGLTAYTYKRTVDNLLFITPRRIRFVLPANDKAVIPIGHCQRPLRADTLRGERIALAQSETVPDGCFTDFTIHLLNKKLVEVTEFALAYGQLKGFGQWRNSGKGRFTYEILDRRDKADK